MTSYNIELTFEECEDLMYVLEQNGVETEDQMRLYNKISDLRDAIEPEE